MPPMDGALLCVGALPLLEGVLVGCTAARAELNGPSKYLHEVATSAIVVLVRVHARVAYELPVVAAYGGLPIYYLLLERRHTHP